MKQKCSSAWAALALATLCFSAFGCNGDSTFGVPSNSSSGGGGDLARTVDCDANEAQRFLAGTCAEGFGDLLACWMPSGKCRIELMTNGDFDVIFDNGARLEQEVDAVALSVDGQYISASGAACGSFTTGGDFGAGAARLNFMLPGGEMFSLEQNGDDFDIVCPGGQTVPLSDVERQIIDECASAGQGENFCTTPGGGGSGDDIDIDDLDEIDLICRVDSDCPSVAGSQLRCCGPSIGNGERLCFVAEACSFL